MREEVVEGSDTCPSTVNMEEAGTLVDPATMQKSGKLSFYRISSISLYPLSSFELNLWPSPRKERKELKDRRGHPGLGGL